MKLVTKVKKINYLVLYVPLSEIFEECKSNMKSTWRLLNKVITKRKSRNSVQSSFIIDNKEITDPMEIANHFSLIVEEGINSKV